MVITLVTTYVHRVDHLAAAIALDSAAGLKERISTGLACRADREAFAEATRHDAEKIASRVTVAAHLPYRAPRRWQLSAGSLLLMSGASGKRFALPNSKVMVHQPSGGYQGQATDIAIHAEEILATRARLNEIYAKHTGQKLDAIEKANGVEVAVLPGAIEPYEALESVRVTYGSEIRNIALTFVAVVDVP